MKSRITDEMHASIPALIERGMAKIEIAALARAAPIARGLVAPPTCSAFNVGLTSAALALARWNPECRLWHFSYIAFVPSDVRSLGTFRTWRDVRLESVIRADSPPMMRF